MKKRISYLMGAGLVVAGLLAAQAPQPNADRPARGQRWAAQGKGMQPGMPLARMARFLELTDNQKTQAQAIFKSAADNARPAMTQMREARQALNAAAKNNAPKAELDRLAQNIGNLQAQLAANRAESFAQFYQILTPEQRQKLDEAQNRMRNRGAQGMRRGAGPGRAQQQ